MVGELKRLVKLCFWKQYLRHVVSFIMDDFPKRWYDLGFGKSSFIPETTNFQIGEGIVKNDRIFYSLKMARKNLHVFVLALINIYWTPSQMTFWEWRAKLTKSYWKLSRFIAKRLMIEKFNLWHCSVYSYPNKLGDLKNRIF